MTSSAIRLLVNAAQSATRRVSALFPGHFEGSKHNHYADFGWPTTLTFQNFYHMYTRNGLAKAAVRKIARKTWQTYPELRGGDPTKDPTDRDVAIAEHFRKIRLWQHMAETDRRSMVGNYAGLILRIADNRKFNQPVGPVSNGIEALVEVIPAWEGQLRVAEYVTDQTDENYGKPSLYYFEESAVGDATHNQKRSFSVHPDRVLLWSEDGSVHSRSMLEAGYNDLLSLEKIMGAGGEGFWRNAKAAPILEVDPNAQLEKMAKAMGTTVDGLADAMNDQVDDYQKGFDKMLMLQGIEAKALNIQLPNPQFFRQGSLENFAASVEIPTKVLVGMQTGERASSEDAQEFANTCMGRRNDEVIPGIFEFVDRMEQFGMLPDLAWTLKWTDLTEADIVVKIERADKMAGVNKKMAGTGSLVFTPLEIRDAVGLGPLSEEIPIADGATPGNDPSGDTPDSPDDESGNQDD